MNKTIQKDTTKPDFDSVDYEIIRLTCETPSISQTQIAKKIGYSRIAIQRRMANPELKAAIARTQTQITDKILVAKHKAADRLLSLVSSENEHIAMQAVKLCLGGYNFDEKPAHDIIYRVRFGEQGQMYQEQETVYANTLELMKDTMSS